MEYATQTHFTLHNAPKYSASQITITIEIATGYNSEKHSAWFTMPRLITFRGRDQLQLSRAWVSESHRPPIASQLRPKCDQLRDDFLA